MRFIIVSLILVAGLGGLIAYYGRHWLCIRRKDCCGKGCGCLFPKNPDAP